MVHEMTQFTSPPLIYPSSTYLYTPLENIAQSAAWGPTDIQQHPSSSAATTPTTSSSSTPGSSTASVGRRKARRTCSAKRSGYKHVPHREKPAHLVARRNARERRRVQAVNTAFSRLRKSVPTEGRNKRLSKVKTLHRAIEYIQMLQEVLAKADEELEPGEFLMNVDSGSLNKENEVHQRWLPTVTNWENDNPNSCLSFYDDFGDPLES